ncbi:Copper chaperone CopZ [Oceanobacillus limi]|uniref:Copper chaperone CopZ n=1 Tax=Oceanobacillus limi TaxID=930131 RepID=A0A1I0GAL2_9BACI|nr:heavy metal-associated domain-containing protein [Oceanobacillus limi]SET67927.1 Copper chaperone CopZ [Oceanobacillus limi]
MDEVTLFVREATSGGSIQHIEEILNNVDGIERVLVDTDDGELKIEYNNKHVSKERIAITLQQHNYHIM